MGAVLPAALMEVDLQEVIPVVPMEADLPAVIPEVLIKAVHPAAVRDRPQEAPVEATAVDPLRSGNPRTATAPARAAGRIPIRMIPMTMDTMMSLMRGIMMTRDMTATAITRMA